MASTRVGAWDNYPDWGAGDPIARVSHDYVTQANAEASQRSCVVQPITVRGYDSQKVCVTQRGGWRYGLYGYTTMNYGLLQTETFFVVSLGSDTDFYIVDNMGGSVAPLDSFGSDTIVYAGPNDGDISVYRDFPRHLVRTSSGYRFIGLADTVHFSDGTDVWQLGATVSRNGEWLVAETGWGIVRVDLRTLDTRIISTFTSGIPGRYSGAAQLAISDDGQTIFATGRAYEQRSFAAITVNDDCSWTDPYKAPVECPAHNLTAPFDDSELPDGWPLDFKVGTHGNRLDFYVQGIDGKYTRASLYPAGSAPLTLHYLALGDSFSSGEGDAGSDGNGIPNYLAYTDVSASTGAPAEKCHLSRRSYPFDLAAMAGFGTFTGPVSLGVQSVACNNAHIHDISAHTNGDYQGQDGRLSGLNTAQLEDYRTAAQNEFIPGRIPQSDFVEAYQPSSVSLGIGGNDIQFATIIKACASSIITCDYARNPTDRRNLGESIKALYPKLVTLYTELSRDDSGVKLFAVGYPRFVNESNRTCPANVNLDLAERQMMDEGVKYLNSVIRAAAVSAGVGYLDVQDALVDHRLCDGPATYVNSIDFANLTAQEQFHPTAAGHQAMTMAIERQLGGTDLALHNYCPSNSYPCPFITNPPSLPVFFGDMSVRPTYVAVPSELLQITDSVVPYLITKGVEFAIQTTLLAASSSVRIELHSDAADLGSMRVSDTGVARVTLTIPDSIPTGYHTLHVYGISPSGEAVDVYQVVYVTEKAKVQNQADSSDESSMKSTIGMSKSTPVSCSRNCNIETTVVNVVLNTIKSLPATLGHHIKIVVAAGFIIAGVLLIAVTSLLWRRRVR